MKQTVFTSPTLDDALTQLRKLGATVTPEIRAMAHAQAYGMILGKFNSKSTCRDGYRIFRTPLDVIPLIKTEHPNTTASDHTYMVIVCTNAKNEKALIKGLGI